MEYGTRLGPYEIQSQLGAGGMGEVYRAHDPRLRRDVALKVVTEDGQAKSLDRLEREARSASTLSHPNVVAVYDIGRQGEVAYIAMELVDGQSLGQRLAAGPIPLAEAMGIASQVAAGLAAAHSRGVLHRDLKPGNIMLTVDGVAKIVDFGLAKWFPFVGDDEKTAAIEESLTATGAIMGTVAYMSPEQAAGRQLDTRSDQFSFGTMLYEMVTGTRPFAEESAAETLAAILGKDPTPADTLVPLLPAPVVAIIDRCLAKNPEERYAATPELADAMEGARQMASEEHRESPLVADTGSWAGWPLYATAALAVALAVGVASKQWNSAPEGPAGSASPSATAQVARSQRPAIAVLPFENLSADPDEGYFSSGISEDLITRLGSWRNFPVISHFSSFNYESEPADVREVGRDLGARYLVLGSVQRVDDSVRIAARLIDANDGRVLWSEQYDRRFEDLLALQEQISTSIVNMMYPQLDAFDQERALAEPPPSLDAWDWAQRGWWHWNRGSRAELEDAKLAFQQAVGMEPGFAEAHAGLALTHYFDLTTGSVSPQETIEQLVAAAQTAVSHDPRSAIAQHALGHAYALTGDRERMLAAYSRAVELNPSSALVMMCSGEGMALAGKHEQAIPLLEEAMRLSPLDPLTGYAQHALALAHFAAGRYEEAVESANRALQYQPTFAWAYRTLAATLVQLDRLTEARAAMNEAMRHEPQFTVAGGARVLLTADPQTGERYLESLRLAGMPDPSGE